MNGFEALHLVRQSLGKSKEDLYDIIILDLNMPISNGYDACSKIDSIFESQEHLKLNSTVDYLESENQPNSIAARIKNSHNSMLKEQKYS